MPSSKLISYELSLDAERGFGKFFVVLGVIAAALAVVCSLFWFFRDRFLFGLEVSLALAALLIAGGLWHLRRAARPGAQPLGPRFMMLGPGLMALSSAVRLPESLTPPSPRAIFDGLTLLFALAYLVWLYRLHRTRQRSRALSAS